ncbi:hypothetical protein [Paraburkholderia sediminicola]|uniref:hypothetical protein n=1 Tax=Paraburkholderia sediminicola TaxID=458836 RepID=UPI0038B75E7A
MTVSYYRSLLNFNQMYAQWVQQPAIPFFGKSLRTVRAVMMVVSASLLRYEQA